MSPTIPREILTRLDQIRRLTERGATKAEQEAAAAALTRLLTKHNLTMQEFIQRTTDLDTTNPTEGYIKDFFVFPAKGTWRGELLSALCEATYCRPLFYSDGKSTVIIGEPHNVETTKRLFGYLDKDISRLAKSSYQVFRVFGVKTPAKTFTTSFKLGCVQGIREAIRQAQQDTIQTIPSGSQLQICKDEQLTQAVNAFFPTLGKSRVKATNLDPAAYFAGKNAGADFTIGERL